VHALSHCKRTRAFTLVELLAVMAIVATLASLTLTGLAKARSKARASQCTQNLKQLGLGLATFIQTYHAYPFEIRPPNLKEKYPEHRAFWGGAIMDGEVPSFISNEPGPFNCPSASKPSTPEWLPHDGFSDYGYNTHGQVGPNGEGNLGLGGAGASDGSEVRPVHEAEVVRPASMFAIGDSAVGNKDALNDGLSIIARTAQALRRPNAESRVLRRHDGKLQTLFCDGRIESISVSRLFKSEAPVDLASWNRDNLSHPERLK
jgi:prepilin-type N-terminal cleavage/methylation domain-containing protein/prepilin-type processing-associated H-X9-DG protein